MSGSHTGLPQSVVTPCIWCGGDVVSECGEDGILLIRRIHSRCLPAYTRKHGPYTGDVHRVVAREALHG
jgi:hypothetical protein